MGIEEKMNQMKYVSPKKITKNKKKNIKCKTPPPITRKKKTKASPKKFRNSVAVSNSGRQNPSRLAKGRKLDEEEISRLSRESNAQLRSMIGEKKSALFA